MKSFAGDKNVNPGDVVGIIGGFGGMGRLFSAVFERAGYKVLMFGKKNTGFQRGYCLYLRYYYRLCSDS